MVTFAKKIRARSDKIRARSDKNRAMGLIKLEPGLKRTLDGNEV